VKARSNPKSVMKLNNVYLHKLSDTENYNNLYNNYLLSVAEKSIRLLTSSLFIIFHSLLRNFLSPSRARDALAARGQASGMMNSHLLVVSGVK
jgi:hypothetical protein